MKAVFVVYNQSLAGHVQEILSQLSIRGYTQWTNIMGTGSVKGLPHEGTHTWPELNNAYLIVIDDAMVPDLLKRLQLLNEELEDQGLRAFVWNIESAI
jgi:nitrogen regulatory protein PII